MTRDKEGGRAAAPLLTGAADLMDDPVVRAVRDALPDEGLFLTGGAPRNLFLGAPLPDDYDFVLAGRVDEVAGRTARALGGTAFIMDSREPVWRVAATVEERPVTIDFTPPRAPDIKRDLMERDFTIDAIGIDLDRLFAGMEGAVLDPAGGIEDCRKKMVRMTGPGVFDADPLRAIRAVRLAAEYGLDIEEGTRRAIREKSFLIAERRVAAERIRDELVKIFSAPLAAAAARELYNLGIIDAVIPEISGWADVDGYGLLAHVLRTLEEAERILQEIEKGTFPFYPGELADHYTRRLSGDVSLQAVLKLAAFFHDAGKPLTISREDGRLRFTGHDHRGALFVEAIFKRLRLSRKVSSAVAGLVKNHHRVFMLADLEVRSKRARGHFFRVAENLYEGAGIDLLLLALADGRATRGSEAPGLLSITEEMLRFYFEDYLKSPPEPLMDGREVMAAFGVPEGPEVGRILRLISEGVEAGEVTTKADAIEYVRKRIKTGGGKRGDG